MSMDIIQAAVTVKNKEKVELSLLEYKVAVTAKVQYF